MVTELQSKALATWSKKLISGDEFKKIADAVARVEASTTAEIVPVLVRRSVHVGHAFWQILFLTLALFFALHVFEYETVYNLPPTVWMAINFFALVGLAAGLARIPFLARLCVPHHDQARQVHDRAELEFFEEHVMDTNGHNGILLFVSYEERRAIVLADKEIAAKVSPTEWQEVCDLLTRGIREHSLCEGYVRALGKCEVILRTHFSRTGGSAVATNELSNELVIKD